MTARTGEQTRRPASRPLLVLAAVVAAALTLTACGTGQRAQTAVETPVVDGVEATVGSIAIRDLAVQRTHGRRWLSSPRSCRA